MGYHAAPLTSFWLLASEYPRLSSAEPTWEVEREIYDGYISVCADGWQNSRCFEHLFW
jgi:hypothetical protein